MKRFLFLYLSLQMYGQVIANIGPAGFAQFGNYYFIETGTYLGDGLSIAMQSGEFTEFRSIEYDKDLYDNAGKKFSDYLNVSFWHGDSRYDLWDMIKDIDKPATFWLDAHIYPPRADGGKNCPLIEELQQIGRHPIKTHTILIDDMICAGTDSFDYLTKEDLIQEILKINPNYQISYMLGGPHGERPDDIMIAIVP